MKKNYPIGIFDSGIGGLTVAKAISEMLPNENLIYFGDTAHTPWGNQSALAIQHYSTKISELLIKFDCKIIVIACNSASASAFYQVQKLISGKAEVFNVIDPAVEYAANKFPNCEIGVIGTKQTISSQSYRDKLAKYSVNTKLQALATPLLAPLVEEGFLNTQAETEILEHYLNNPILKDIKALILGCTHYPLLKKQIEKFYTKKVEVIDSASMLAKQVSNYLVNNDLLSDKISPEKRFYVSHDSDFFNSTAKQFFPGEIHLETFPIWD